MPAAVPVPLREAIIDSHQGGESLGAIATRLELSYWTVRKLWRRYRTGGKAGLKPAYARCGSRRARRTDKVYRAAIWLKRGHPQWGGGLIRVVIEAKWPTVQVPSVRTVQRWFREAGVARRARHHKRAGVIPRAQAAHETWEIDAKEQIKLASGEQVSWCLVTDERSGAVLAGEVFPPATLDPGSTLHRAGLPAPGVRGMGLTGTGPGR